MSTRTDDRAGAAGADPHSSPAAHPAPEARRRLWAGRILTAIPALFLLFDGAMKLVVVREVTDSMRQLGWEPAVAPTLGVILLSCLALYLYPRTAVLGAILLTGYLGGAVATHVRVGSSLLTHVLFPVYVGVLLWGGLYLRDARLRALLPVRRE